MNRLIEQVTGKRSFGIDEYAGQLNRQINMTGKITGALKKYYEPLSRHSIAIFHFSNATRSILIPLIKRRGGTNIVLIHDVFPRSGMVLRVYPILMRIISHNAHTVLVHTHTARDLLVGAFPFFNKNHIEVIPHGTFIHDITPGEKEKLRLKHGFNASQRILFMLGGITKKRGQARFLEAFDAVKNNNLKLIISGHVSDEKALSIINKNNSIVYHGFADNVLVDECYRMCDATAVYREHSVGESSSSIAYGLGFGKPLLASATDSFIEMIGDSGIFFHNTREEITRLLEKFAAGEIDLASLEQHARQLREVYRWENYLRKILALNAN